jgi:hypothetical protein
VKTLEDIVADGQARRDEEAVRERRWHRRRATFAWRLAIGGGIASSVTLGLLVAERQILQVDSMASGRVTIDLRSAATSTGRGRIPPRAVYAHAHENEQVIRRLASLPPMPCLPERGRNG